MNAQDYQQARSRLERYDRLTALIADRRGALEVLHSISGNASQVKPAAVIRIYDKQSNFVDIKDSGLSDYEIRRLLDGAIQSKVAMLAAELASV